MEEDLRIGVAIGRQAVDPYAFGQVVSLAVDDRGNVYVADADWNEIRIFNGQGQHVRSIGGEGEGPGEFKWLAGAVWHEALDVVWAVDVRGRALMGFDPNGELLAQHPYGPGSRNAELAWRAWAADDGHLYRMDPDSGLSNHLLRHRVTARGAILSTDRLAVPEIEKRYYSRRFDYGIATSALPMQPKWRWAVGPDGAVWLGRSDAFKVHQLAFSGDTLRTVQLSRAAEPLQGRERDSVAAKVGVSARVLPEFKPVMGEVTVGADGWLWVALERADRLHAWEVFDEAGRYRGLAVPPVPLMPVPWPVVRANTVTGVVEDDLGTQRVVRFRVDRERRSR